ncbi:MAG TPA: DNA replication/repair protein RecF [Actinomycetota bacterium]|nr:DNA replication/repair protein RecF [Actinomycetota bacterium]
MRLAWLEVRDFRNHRETSVEFPSEVVVVLGPNAQGKTNLLEAIHYLLTLSSPRASSDEPLVRRGADRAYLRGEVETSAGRVLVEVEVRASGANRIQVNRSAVRRKRDLRQRVRSVMFIPEDLAIVQGQPEDRRRFLDETSLALWPALDAARRSYDRALRQRNRLLKEHDGSGAPDGLEAWDGELVQHGTQVTLARAAAVARVGPRAGDDYEALAGERLAVRYRSSVAPDGVEAAGGSVEDHNNPDSVAALSTWFHQRLAARRSDELLRRTTLVGPHRDDLELLMGDLTARGFASHGEAWAATLCLRLGLAGAVALETRDPPVLVLDDPFSGLDPIRRRRVGEELPGRGQVVVAVPDEAQVPPDAKVWEVEDGRVRT